MDKTLKQYLEKHNINYKVHEHEAVFTVEESKKLKPIPDVFHTKNLFLKDEAKNFYLVCMDAFQRLNLKALKEKIQAVKKLTFASPTELKEHLNLTPGSVSIFGMIYAKDVELIIDKKVWQAKKVGFHPNINTATLEVNHENLEKFYSSLDSKKQIMEIPV
jgi:Ala-tRNA(Pro) deacylase